MSSPARTAGPARPVSPPVPPSHPGFVIASLVAALAIAVSVSFRMFDTDVWQHLAVGRAIWELHRVPQTHLWSWPTYGEPEVLPSWGFRALLWPFFAIGGVPGLFVWRWLTTLGAFALLWATARRMGAKSFAPLLVLVVCSLVYRQRSQVRPETLVAVLIALEIWILETRRSGGPDRCAWLIAVAWAWANCHISYYLGFVILGFHLIEAQGKAWRGAGARMNQVRGGTRPPAGSVRRLWLVALAMALISFANPFGWRALAQPFEYAFVWSHRQIFQNIGELGPFQWRDNWRNGAVFLFAGWPLLVLWRARARRFDAVEAMMCAFFTVLAASSQRFLGPYALAAVPYLGRGLDEQTRGWTPPRALGTPWMRAAAAALACALIGIPEWSRGVPPLGLGFDLSRYPVAACDFIALHGVRGSGFNQYYLGGYMLWRFWPEVGRLPFMDIHQSGTPADVELYPVAIRQREAWDRLDAERHFDYALLERKTVVRGVQVLEFLGADSGWALVFEDDAAALFVRRAGPLGAVADSFAYRLLGPDSARLAALGRASSRDSTLRTRVRGELLREIAASPYHAIALSLLANVDILDGRLDAARAHLREALALDSRVPHAHERLGNMALDAGDAREALREFQLERRLWVDPHDLDLRTGHAWRMLGDARRAREWYREALGYGPDAAEARLALEELDAGSSR